MLSPEERAAQLVRVEDTIDNEFVVIVGKILEEYHKSRVKAEAHADAIRAEVRAALEAHGREAVEGEREACAKRCDDYADDETFPAAASAARVIRQRIRARSKP